MCLLTRLNFPEEPSFGDDYSFAFHQWRRRIVRFLVRYTRVCLNIQELVPIEDVQPYLNYLAGYAHLPLANVFGRVSDEELPPIGIFVTAKLCNTCKIHVLSYFDGVQDTTPIEKSDDIFSVCFCATYEDEAPCECPNYSNVALPGEASYPSEAVIDFLKHGSARMSLMCFISEKDLEFRAFQERMGYVGINSFRQWTVDLLNSGDPTPEMEFALDVKVTSIMLHFSILEGFDLLSPFGIAAPIVEVDLPVYNLPVLEVLDEVDRIQQQILDLITASCPPVPHNISKIQPVPSPTVTTFVHQYHRALVALSSLFSSRFFLHNYKFCIG